MKAIGPKLPLQKDDTFGFYSLVSQYREEIQQNLKNLLLTAPGERIMNPDFGVGIRHFLFEPRHQSISIIRQKVEQQVRKYMPFIRNLKVQFDTGLDQEYLDSSSILSINIIYEIPGLNLSSNLLLQKEDIS